MPTPQAPQTFRHSPLTIQNSKFKIFPPPYFAKNALFFCSSPTLVNGP